MPRYKITVEYDGTPYVGWQRQINGPSVQEALERAIRQLAGDDVLMFGAGRTDTGVHATGQVAHFDLDKDRSIKTVRDAMNAYLVKNNEPIAVLDAEIVPDDFDARFSAKARHYHYIIHVRRPPLTHNRLKAWWCANELDIEAMNRAAQHLIGTHDFTTFRSVACQSKSPVKTLDILRARLVDSLPEETWQTIEIYAFARSFLHNQVRSLAGTLKLVGEGRWSEQRMIDALEAKDRQACGTVAPPQGLYLSKVDY